MQPTATESTHETSTVTAADTVLVLRCVRKDMTSRAEFVYPASGPVTAPDWDPKPECGNGLHGWLWGVGDLDTCDYYSNEGTRWAVLAVDRADLVDLHGKVKFRAGTVVFVGDRPEAVAYVVARCPRDTYPMFGVSVVGNRGTATAGYRGTATAGNRGTANAGYRGTANAGYRGTANAGYRGTATAGDGGTVTAGDGGTATAGDGGTATAGEGGTATAGYQGTAIAGYGGTANAGYRGTATAGNDGTATAGGGGTATAGRYGTATAGNGGTATAGNGGTATAGEGGRLLIEEYRAGRVRVVVGYVGEDDIRPDVKYRLDDAGKFVEA